MTEKRLRVVFMGTPDFAAAALEKLVPKHDVVAVYSQPPRPAGRGLKLQLSPVHCLAEKLNIPVFYPSSLKGTKEQTTFAEHKADVAVVAAYGLLLPKAILETPRMGCLNIHASLLPRWRGAAPIQRAIMSLDTETGITIMQMDEGLDTGDIISKQSLPITASATASSLHDELMSLGAKMICDVLYDLANSSITATPQPTDGVTYAQKIDKTESRIHWDQPATKVSAHIRGLSPFPGAWCEFNGKRLKILNATVTEEVGEPGTTLDDNLLVACADGAVRLTHLQLAGKKATDATVFLNGYPTPAKTKLD